MRAWLGLVVIAAVGVAVAVPAAGADGEAALPQSGIRGIVQIGGACPGPERPAGEGEPCDPAPFEADVRVLRQRDGHEMATFRSRPDGRFRVRLRRGRYLLDPQEGGGGLYKGTILVRVQRGEFTRIKIVYDDGLR